ncbi:hypothetical protein [Modestobacter sp. Leaf380]|uniref:hypothetical protein n=1 Tax=Modestobacter sp. Leaf380 TaxID=1736356 RepID=UPI0012F7B24B|nr:hypothetical protein [Modestobacter sp. Leaf380]
MSASVLTPPTTVHRRPPAALLVLFGLLVLSLVARLVFTLTEPPFDGSLRYDDLIAMDGAYWPLNLYLGGPGYLVSFVSTAVFLVLLGRGHGSALTLAGALLVGLGGTVFSLAITAEALPFAHAVDPTLFGEAEGRAWVSTLNGRLDLLAPAIVGSQVAIGVGGLVGLVGVLLSRTTPRWAPVAGIVGIVVSQVLPLAALGYLLQLVVLAGIGWAGSRVRR